MSGVEGHLSKTHVLVLLSAQVFDGQSPEQTRVSKMAKSAGIYGH